MAGTKMSLRYASMRIVDPGAGTDVVQLGPFDLWWAAISAAEETIQGSPLASAWLRLFQDHLSRDDTSELRWAGDLAESAEMRRAYSALYGRFFGRAFLASRLGITDFVPLRSDRTRVGNLAEVRRVKRGDVPDWIAWDPHARSYVLAEAKGRLGGTVRGFLSGTPACINSGKAQFERVEARDARRGRIATKNWVAANLWCTDRRGGRPVCLLWDPDGEGDELLEEEVTRHAAAVRRQRIASIAGGLGHPGFPEGGAEPRGRTVRIAAAASEPPKAPEAPEAPAIPLGFDEERRFPATAPAPIAVTRVEPEPRSRERHEDAYVAAVITRFGITPIIDQLGVDAARAAQDRAGSSEEPALIYGISRRALAGPEAGGRGWLSGGGIVSRDGAGLFDIARVEIGAD